MSGEDCLRRWKLLVQKHLGRKISCKSRQIRFDLLSVDVGIKPGFLFDYGISTAAQVGTLLQTLHKENLIRNGNLHIVDVGQDVLVINVDRLGMYVETLETRTIFVDVSGSLKIPRLVDKADWEKVQESIRTVKKICSDLKEYVTGFQAYYSSLLPMANVSTVYGLLLGYPTVYWYEQTENNDVTTCLSMEPLRNYKVLGTERQDKGHNSGQSGPDKDRHVVYSFSVPERFAEQTLTTIEAWLKEVQESGDWKNIYTDISHTCNVRAEVSVAL